MAKEQKNFIFSNKKQYAADQVTAIKTISNLIEGDDVLQNNLNYIEKTLTNNTKHEESGTLLIQANQNQNDDDIVNNDINKLTYKLSQNASNSKLAKAIISKIANTINTMAINTRE